MEKKCRERSCAAEESSCEEGTGMTERRNCPRESRVASRRALAPAETDAAGDIDRALHIHEGLRTAGWTGDATNWRATTGPTALCTSHGRAPAGVAAEAALFAADVVD